MALALVLVLLPLGCDRQRAAEPPLLAISAPSTPLQEVAPPPGVLQLAGALADHTPLLRILAPADGATLPDGPWTLRLQVRDWPLVDANELGLGAHVVVQLDDEPPQRLAQASDSSDGELSLAMPPLRPGSHRLTVYAARPWGEAVKQPGAFRQIQLQRVAATPLRVPAAGSPQLIAVSPGPEPQPEPVLLDWLLLDAPLQGLREGDASWRLRISVNGDSFLVDQNSPLWLKGWRNGSNSLQLDLVDGRGEPINPPFNSQVSEVVIQAGAPRPSWFSRLEPAPLARLLGQAVPAPEPEPQAAPQPELQPSEAPLPETPASEAVTPELVDLGRALEPTIPTPIEPDLSLEPGELDPEPEPQPEPEPATAVELQRAETDLDGSPAPSSVVEAPPATAADSPAPQGNPERIAPSTSLSGSAREQVRDDGSLIQPRRQGPLAGLREQLRS